MTRADQSARCQTPGTLYSIHVGERHVAVQAALPMSLALDKAQAVALESAVHEAVAAVLAPYWRPWTVALALPVKGKHEGRHR